MDKYGVETADENKTANEGTRSTCPVCGSTLAPVAVTGVLLCPKCGTKPFERETGP